MTDSTNGGTGGNREPRLATSRPQPEGLGVEVSETRDRSQIYVPGRGLLRGPALGFTVMAVILGLIGVVGLIKFAIHPDLVAVQGTLVFGGTAAALLLLGIWRGRWGVTIEVLQSSIRISSVFPLWGRLRGWELRWSEIRDIRAEWLKPGNTFGPPVPCMEVELATGGRHYYLRGYPADGIQWIADEVAAARQRIEVKHTKM